MELNQNELFAGRYRLEKVLGSGGFGEVWKAFDNVTEQFVAIKIHHRGDTESAAREIVKEFTRMMNIHHANLLTPMHVDVAEDHIPYLVMELCEGDLADIDLTEKDVWRLIRDVAAGLKCLADNKKRKRRPDGTEVEVPDPIIHQDIKPANILLRSNGMYAISDFGISKRRLSTLSTNVQDGSENNDMDNAMTVDYAAPERFPRGKGVAVLASDIWSVGAMLYELVEGHRPFAECGGDCLNPTIGLPIPSIIREGYSDELKNVIYACMALHPDDRPTAAQLQDYADKVLRGAPRTRTWASTKRKKSKSAPKPEQTTISKRSIKWWPFALGAVAIVTAVILFPSNTSSKTFSVGDVSFNMVKVNGGTYTMGCTTEQGNDCFDDEKPAHSVTVSDFYMGQTEVTQALWNAVMGSNPSRWEGDSLPVESVSYNDVEEFIGKLNGMTRKTFRLPTEEEWEYAVRGGDKSRGYKYSGSDIIDSVAWYEGNSGKETHPVAQKKANELGLYDMSGNVWEWCGSQWSLGYNNVRLGSSRVRRGGCWCSNAGSCRLSSRSGLSPSLRHDYLGFRIALSSL